MLRRVSWKPTFYSCRGYAVILVILKPLCSVNLRSRYWSVFSRWPFFWLPWEDCAPMAPTVVQSLSRVTPWRAARQASLSSTISQSLLKLMSIESVMPSNRPIFCCPPLLLSSIFPSIMVSSQCQQAFRVHYVLVISFLQMWKFSPQFFLNMHFRFSFPVDCYCKSLL